MSMPPMISNIITGKKDGEFDQDRATLGASDSRIY
jgi:hypothetical protein